MSKHPRILVIGGVAGGASAATRARRCNEHAEITLLEKDGYVSFANCGLPYYLGGEIVEREKLLVAKPALFENRFRIRVKQLHEAIRIDREKKAVEGVNHETGERFVEMYDKLILAPGAAPIIPELPGANADNVFALRNVEDTDAIKAFLDTRKPARAVVVGAGFIGLEMVEQFHRLGIAVDVVELAPQLLAPLDPEMAGMVEETLRKHGVGVYVGTGLKAFQCEGTSVTGVVLDNGLGLPADMVVLGMGVRPSVTLAMDAGLEIGPTGGIAINAYCQTNDPDIYAAGDAVEYPLTYADTPMRVPLAGPANRAGRTAGEHAATGKAQPLGRVQGSAIVRVFDVTAASTGMSEKAAARLGKTAASVVVTGAHHAGYYPGAERLVLKLIYDPAGGKVLGAQAAGGAGVDKRIDVIATALHFGATVYDLATLDLCYAPPFGSAKDPVHMAAFVACNHLDGLVPVAAPRVPLDGMQLVDVRTEEEVACMRLPGAIHIPIEQLRAELGQLDPSLPTAVLCHSGLRSHLGARILMQHGFDHVVNITGGMFLQQYARPELVER
ncbi:MAG: FAD-dependent oxidoreductase [Candidatus Hydrogenedentes bacterium]|nr:FAD-dependent oxidoreductase [Candidatus Hydrogenedentota bacterium]